MGSRFVQVTFRFRDEVSRGMEAASKRLNGVNDKLTAQYSRIGKLGKEWERVGKSMQRTGAALTRSVTVPIVAAGTASAKLAADFDKSMAQVNTLLDDDSHLKSYESAVLSVSSELGIKANTTAQGLYQTISVLGDHGETTEKTFRIMAQSAKAGGAEVVDAVNMIATAMNGYGEVSDATAQRISDLSFKTVKLGKTTFPELANEMSPLFPLAHNLGISYEELYATMSTATTSFAGSTAEASTQIKGLMTGFLKPSKDMQALIEKSGYSSGAAMIKAEGLAGALKRVQAEAGDDGMSKYFGNVRGLTAALGLSGSGMEKFEKHLAEMENASGATGDALAKMADTDAAKWNKALVNAQNAGIKFGKAVLPAVTPLVEKFGNAISKAADWFSNLTEGQQQMIVKTLAIAAATGPVLSILGKGASGVGRLLGHVSKFGKALDATGKISSALIKTFPVAGRVITAFGKGFMAVGKLFMANPILLVIAAIAAGAILIWKNWDKIRPHLQPVIDLFNKMKRAAEDLKNGVLDKFESMKGKIGSFKDRVGSSMKAASSRMRSFMSACSASTSGVMGYLGGLINFIKGVFTGNWRAAWEGVKQIFTSVFNSIKSVASGALNWIASLVSTISSKISSLMSKISSAKSSAGSISVGSGLPRNALGTKFWKGGLTVVHEKGGEIMDLPRGTRIIPHDVSMKMAESAGNSMASKSVTIAKLADTIVVREDADIDRIATAIAEKLEMIQGDTVYA